VLERDEPGIESAESMARRGRRGHVRRVFDVAAIALVSVIPARAGAEVLDKCELPWEPLQIAGPLLASVLCVSLVLVRMPAFGIVAAVGWALYRVVLDPIGDELVGPALRAELGSDGVAMYALALCVAAGLPLTLAVAAMGRGAGRPARHGTGVQF
jgi:hypothetical protein